MPRPKRSKVAPSAPAPRARKASTGPLPRVQAEEERQDDIYDISDTDEGMAGRRSTKKGHGKEAVRVPPRRVLAAQMDLKNDLVTDADYPPRPSGHLPMMTGALPVTEDSSLPEIDLESSSPSLELGRRDSTATAGDSILAIGNFRRRPRQPSILGRVASRARSSSVESNLAEDNGLMSVGKRNSRRPRERHVAPVRSSSMGLEMDRGTPAVGSALRIGNFKRRAREPSILGTAQKQRLQRSQYDLEDEDDFSPDDQSTPLNLSKNKAISSSTGSSNTRKRKLSSAVQVPQSQEMRSSPPRALLSSEGVEEDEDETVPATGPMNEEDEEDELDDENQELPRPSTGARSVTPELPLSDTMAPPQSSSPTPHSPPPPVTHLRPRAQRAPSVSNARPLRSRTPLAIDQDSPPSSPPSLTHSPNGPATRVTPRNKIKTAAPPPATLSTAQLQALLPRRRRHTTRDPFDIASSEDEVDVSGLASDDDELTHSRAPPRRSMMTRPTPSRKAAKPKPIAKGKGKITYGRNNNTTSDKENEEAHDPDDSLGPAAEDEQAEHSPENSQQLEKRVGKELKKAARKFEEVDKWELEFEECTASSSSPKDAR